MRSVPWLVGVMTVLALASLPAVGQNRPGGEVIEKLSFTYTPAAGLLRAAPALPAGISGVLVYPLDNSWILRGTPAAVADAKSAAAVVDVAVQDGRRLEITLRHGSPEAVRTAALALPHPGTVQAQAKTLRFEGSPEWLQAVQGAVFGAELSDPRPIRGAPRAVVGPAGGPAAAGDIVELRVPTSVKLAISADVARVLGDGGETQFEGNVILTLPNGIQLKASRARVTVEPGAGGATVIRIEKLGRSTP